MMKLIAAVFAVLVLGGSLAWAQNCRPGQSVTCTKGFGGSVTCYCT